MISLLFIFNVILSSIKQLFSKELLVHLNNYTLVGFNELIFGIATIALYVFNYIDTKAILELSLKNKIKLVSGSIIGVASVLLYLHLLANSEMSKFAPIFSGAKNTMVVLAGIFFLGESVSINKITGIILTIIGIGLTSI